VGVDQYLEVDLPILEVLNLVEEDVGRLGASRIIPDGGQVVAQQRLS
jgi:hypothetical protein